MVNPGAVATTSLVPGGRVESRWAFIRQGLSRFAGRELAMDDEIYESASQTNERNQSIARLLQSYGRIYSDPSEVLALAKVTAASGGRYISHIRSEDRTFWRAIDEIIAMICSCKTCR